MFQQKLLSLLVAASVILTACQAGASGGAVAPGAAGAASALDAAQGAGVEQPQVDLSGIKSYLVEKSAALHQSAAMLQKVAADYYTLAEKQHFDYGSLWNTDRENVLALVEDARAAWLSASPQYEQIEGVVAGTPALAHYDVDIDAGGAAADDPESAVSFDIHLPGGRVLEKPGNLFGVTESSLWGTFEDYRADVEADFDGNGALEFGEALPDAEVLKGSADLLAQMTEELNASANTWEPTVGDAFTALVVMIPTMSEYFASWRDSRYVKGDSSTQRDFVAISRLADIQDILGGLEVVYDEVRPLVATLDADQATQIAQSLSGLKEYVAGIHASEKEGTHYTPEEADALGAEAQNRASAIVGMIAQIAAQLSVPLAQ